MKITIDQATQAHTTLQGFFANLGNLQRTSGVNWRKDHDLYFSRLYAIVLDKARVALAMSNKIAASLGGTLTDKGTYDFNGDAQANMNYQIQYSQQAQELVDIPMQPYPAEWDDVLPIVPNWMTTVSGLFSTRPVNLSPQTAPAPEAAGGAPQLSQTLAVEQQSPAPTDPENQP